MVNAPIKNKVTISAIAKRAGVSIGLVSMFLRNKTYKNGGTVGLSAQTEEAIIQAARELNYEPNDLAFKLRMYPHSGGLAILLNRRSSAGFAPFYSEIMFGAISDNTEEMNVNISIFESDVDYLLYPEKLPYCVNDNHTSKFIILGDLNYSLALALQKRNLAMCYLLRESGLDGVNSIVPDFEQAAYMAVNYLFEQGHTNIGFIGEHYFQEMGYNAQMMSRGLTRAMAEHGKKFSIDMVVFNREADGGKPSTIWKEYKETRKDTTAVFCMCDYTAQRFMQDAKADGVKIPEELSVIGVNGQMLGLFTEPPLTTIRLPLPEIGRLAMEQLNTGDNSVRVRKLPCELVIRNSVKNLKG